MIVKGQLSSCSLVRLLNQNDVIFQKFNSFGFLGRGYRSRRAYLLFFAPQVQCLFEHCYRQIYFFYIFMQWYTFYLLIFLWTDRKSRIMREIHAVKKYGEFHDNESENISGESIGGAALINLFVPDVALIQGRRLFE